MKLLSLALPASAMGFLAGEQTEMGANPIRRVVTLLQDMAKEIQTEGEKEEALYKKFKCYCKNNDGQLSEDAKVARETIASNNAAAEAKTGQKKQTDAELKQHKADRKEAQAALAQASELRAKEKAKYDQEAGDMKQYISATQGALKALRRGTVKAKQPLSAEDRADAFLQSATAKVLTNVVQAASSVINMDASDQMTMLNFLQGDYHTVGNEIIGILDNMLEEFDKSLNGIVGQETSAVQAYKEMKAAKESEVASATKAIETKTALKGQLAVEIVQHKGSADTAMKELGDAEAFLLNLKQMCAAKDDDWESRSKLRADELSSINEAISVLNDDDALDVFKASLSFVQKRKLSFLQASGKKGVNAAKSVQKILAQVAGSKNAALNLLANTAQQKLNSKATVDFSKIIIMIDDMVKLLKEEQVNDENVQKNCNENFRTSEADRKTSNAKIKSLAASIDQFNAQIAEGKEVVAKKQEEIVQLEKATKEATEQRRADNTEFIETLQLNTSAIQLIEKAKNKLNKFYNPGQYKAPEERDLTEEERLLKGAGADIGDTTASKTIQGTGQSTTIMDVQVSFLQLGKGAAPSLAPPPESYGEHKAKGQKSNSVISLLNLLVEDLKKQNLEAEHNEKTAQKEYETLMVDAANSTADANKAISENQAAVAEAEGSLNQSDEEKTAEETNLEELKAENKRLHEECDFILANFEERRENRTKEIDGLATAKSILSGAEFQ